jgi:2-hydroxychromene-2-carboxylate isomerase
MYQALIEIQEELQAALAKIAFFRQLVRSAGIDPDAILAAQGFMQQRQRQQPCRVAARGQGVGGGTAQAQGQQAQQQPPQQQQYHTVPNASASSV